MISPRARFPPICSMRSHWNRTSLLSSSAVWMDATR
jgi:hypothetical protein